MYLKKLLEIIGEYILSDDATFQDEDFETARALVSNAEREIAVFRKGAEYRLLDEILGAATHSSSAFINAYGIHHRDFDEMSFTMGGHPTATLLPVLMAFGRREDMRIFLQSLKLEIALGRIFNPELYQSQYHPTTIIGLLGSTALASRLLGLRSEQMTNALGISFSFLSGIKGSFGSSAKCLQVAHASQHGLLSAMFAKSGFIANLDLLERNDVLHLFTGKTIRRSHLQTLRRLLSDRFPLRDEFLVKKYDVCGSFHNVIDIALQDRQSFAQPIACIKEVVISMHPERLAHKSIAHPKSAAQKKFSPAYLYAYAFLGHDLATISSSDEIPDAVAAFMKKISVRAKSKMGKWEFKTKIIRRTKL